MFLGILAPGQAAAQTVSSTQHLVKTPDERLDEAVRLYQTGSHHDAKSILASLVNDPAMANEGLRQRARVYLGEVLYLQGAKEETRRLFEAVLLQDPTYVIDPFAHPPDVCGFFETIRAYIRPAAPVATPTPTPTAPGRPPMSAYAGFGIYQFQHGRIGMGATLATAQATLGALSLASFYGLSVNHTWETEGEKGSLTTRRALQWGATAGFYGVWMWGVIDAHRHWRSRQGQALTIHGGLSPTFDGRGASMHVTIPMR